MGGIGAMIRDASPDFALPKPTPKSYPLTVADGVVCVLVKQSITMLAWLLVRPVVEIEKGVSMSAH